MFIAVTRRAGQNSKINVLDLHGLPQFDSACANELAAVLFKCPSICSLNFGEIDGLTAEIWDQLARAVIDMNNNVVMVFIDKKGCPEEIVELDLAATVALASMAFRRPYVSPFVSV